MTDNIKFKVVDDDIFTTKSKTNLQNGSSGFQQGGGVQGFQQGSNINFQQPPMDPQKSFEQSLQKFLQKNRIL